MKAKIISGLFMIMMATGCISEYNAVMSSNDTTILFVDGSIVANTDATFRISRSFSLNIDTIPEESFVNNATLNIVGSNGYKSAPAIPQGKGIYQIAVGDLDDNVEYSVQIEYDGNTYQSAPEKPLYTAEIDTFYWIQPEPFGAVSFYLSTHDDTEGGKFFLWNYTEDWEIQVNNYVTIFYNPQNNEFYTGSPYFYCWKKQVSNTYLLGSTESLSENKIIDKLLYQQETDEAERFSLLYCINVTQKAISKSAYEYYHNITILNEEMGGLFTPQPSEIKGNITCITNPSKKAMGYVEMVKNISQRRIFIDPYRQLKMAFPSDETYCKDNSYSNDYLMKLGWNYRDLYNTLGYRPSDYTIEDNSRIVPIAWSPPVCVDCRAKGGTKNKPDFWPNDHE